MARKAQAHPSPAGRRGLTSRLRGAGRGRLVLLAAIVIGLLAAPFAVAAGTGRALLGGERNPGFDTTSALTRETQIVGDIAQGQGGVATGTGGFTTRQSNKSDSGGGAIYGCRAKAGTEACVAANNLANGSAFRFQANGDAPAVGEIRFGTSINALVDKPPFATNGTGLVKNLNADMVGGKHASDLVDAGQLLFAVVDADGKLPSHRGATGVAVGKGTPVEFTVTFDRDVSKCAYTASPTSTEAGTVAVAPGKEAKDVVVTESGAKATGFHLQVTC
jgi:hypothetical protein